MAAIEKPVTRKREKAARKRAQAKVTATVRAFVFTRDKGRCRVCGGQAHELHELRFRSLGGKVSMHNSIAICRGCHSDMQEHRVDYMFIDDRLGANGLIHFTHVTKKELRSWVG
jgi:5-methylcytosine-specific restriction endonuclease McrA